MYNRINIVKDLIVFILISELFKLLQFDAQWVKHKEIYFIEWSIKPAFSFEPP